MGCSDHVSSLCVLNCSPLGTHFVWSLCSHISVVSSSFLSSVSIFFQIFIFLPGLVTASDIAVLVWFIQILGSFFHFIFLFSYALGWRVCLSDFIWNVFSALDNSFCNFRHTFRYAQFLISMLTLHQSVKLFACIVIPAKTTSPPFCCYLWAGRYQRTCSYMDHTYLFSLYTLLFCGFCKTSCK